MFSLRTAVLALALLGSGQGETVLLDFSADWCIPCRQMEPAVEELTARGYPVRKINIDRDRALAAQYRVDRVPCFVMLVDGQEVDRVVGGTTFSRLERMCQLAQACKQQARPVGQQVPGPPAGSPPSSSAVAGESPFVDASHPSATLPAGDPAPESVPPGQWRRGTSSRRDGTDTDLPSDEVFIAATVRLRIEDPHGHSWGTGTIIDARNGEALILTCGHLFRDSKGQGRIEVDLFGPHPAERIPGQLICYDVPSEIGLLKIRVPGPVVTARVAPPGYRVAKGDRVVNVGCNNGELPTARHSRVTAVDRYEGPPNLEVAGMPVLGRSGGGLFSEEGLVIGVCMAADDQENKGLYSALGVIHAQLDEVDLSFVYRGGPEGSVPESSIAAVTPPAVPKQMPPPSDVGRSTVVPVVSLGDLDDRPAPSSQGRLSDEEQAALEEIRRRRLEGAEVVCVIRSRSDPRAPSEIIVLENVSASFLNQLAAERAGEGPNGRYFTSLAVPDSKGSRPGPTAREYSGPPAQEPIIEYRTADRRGPQVSR